MVAGMGYSSMMNTEGTMQRLPWDLQPGDEIENRQGFVVTLTHVIRGEHGVFLRGSFRALGNQSFNGYVCPEMPPPETVLQPWRAFLNLSWVVLDGRRWAIVDYWRNEVQRLSAKGAFALMERKWEESRVSMGA